MFIYLPGASFLLFYLFLSEFNLLAAFCLIGFLFSGGSAPDFLSGSSLNKIQPDCDND